MYGFEGANSQEVGVARARSYECNRARLKKKAGVIVNGAFLPVLAVGERGSSRSLWVEWMRYQRGFLPLVHLFCRGGALGATVRFCGSDGRTPRWDGSIRGIGL